MFSQTVEYALRAMVFLSNQSPQGCTTQQISQGTRVTAPYLSKVLQSLCRSGLLTSQRGVGGGFMLTKDPGAITILEVVNAVDPIRRIRQCPLGLESHGTHLCPLHRRMDEAMAQVESAFAASTLAEILAEPTTSIPLCEFPTAAAPKS